MNKSTIFLLSSPTVLASMVLMLLSDKLAEARKIETNLISSKTQAASPGKLMGTLLVTWLVTLQPKFSRYNVWGYLT